MKVFPEDAVRLGLTKVTTHDQGQLWRGTCYLVLRAVPGGRWYLLESTVYQLYKYKKLLIIICIILGAYSVRAFSRRPTSATQDAIHHHEIKVSGGPL